MNKLDKITATLDDVAGQLDQRGANVLATEVDKLASKIAPDAAAAPIKDIRTKETDAAFARAVDSTMAALEQKFKGQFKLGKKSNFRTKEKAGGYDTNEYIMVKRVNVPGQEDWEGGSLPKGFEELAEKTFKSAYRAERNLKPFVSEISVMSTDNAKWDQLVLMAIGEE